MKRILYTLLILIFTSCNKSNISKSNPTQNSEIKITQIVTTQNILFLGEPAKGILGATHESEINSWAFSFTDPDYPSGNVYKYTSTSDLLNSFADDYNQTFTGSVDTVIVNNNLRVYFNDIYIDKDSNICVSSLKY
jgi:hypothetical protein